MSLLPVCCFYLLLHFALISYCCSGTGMKAGVAHPSVYTHPLIGTFPHVSGCHFLCFEIYIIFSFDFYLNFIYNKFL